MVCARNRLNSRAAVTLSQFGRIVPNDWPVVVPAKFMLAGKARDFWYVHHNGKAPWFCGHRAAERALRQLYREFGHTVTVAQCRSAFRRQKRETERRAREFRLAVAWDIAKGRARINGQRLTLAGLGTATLANESNL